MQRGSSCFQQHRVTQRRWAASLPPPLPLRPCWPSIPIANPYMVCYTAPRLLNAAPTPCALRAMHTCIAPLRLQTTNRLPPPLATALCCCGATMLPRCTRRRMSSSGPNHATAAMTAEGGGEGVLEPQKGFKWMPKSKVHVAVLHLARVAATPRFPLFITGQNTVFQF
jgi:hypothetical protein